jgi:hypothetical protein
MNNPPAFPSGNEVTLGNLRSNGHSGMTLRDYMAAKAMQGMLADPSTPEIMDIAGAAYEVADAMLKAREA